MGTEAKRGDRVSLNTANRLFYFQEGEGGIHLAAGIDEVAIIPQNATEMHLAQINHAIKAEQLVIGWVEQVADVLDKDSELKSLLECGRNKIDEWISKFRDDKSIKRDLKISQIERLVALEKLGKNRKSVMTAAENTLSYIGGVSAVEDSEQEVIEIKLTSGNSEIPEDK